MSPFKEVKLTEAGFLEQLLKKLGSPLDGQAFRVAFGDERTERIVVVGKNFVASDKDVLVAIGSLLTGGEVFRPISAVPTAAHPGINSVELDPSMSLHDLFQGESPRVPNVLQRGGLGKVGEVLEVLRSENGEKKLDAIRNVGPKTIAEVKRKLGMG